MNIRVVAKNKNAVNKNTKLEKVIITGEKLERLGANIFLVDRDTSDDQ